MTKYSFGTITSRLGFGLTVILSSPFALIGTFLGYFTLATIVRTFDMQSWPTIPAILENVELKDEGSKDEEVRASYKYVVNGNEHLGKKVSLYGSGNVGSFHKTAFKELQEYFSRGAPYPAHVNPRDPNDSILMPVFRWELLGFNLLFVVLFGGVGWGLLIASFFGYKKFCFEKKLMKQFPGEPWKQRQEWYTGQIKSSENLSAIGAVVVAILWNISSSPILIALPDKIRAGEYLILAALIIPLAGLGFIYWAIVSVLRARRFGETYLKLDTFPGRQGENFRAHIFAPAALGEAKEVKLIMSCNRNYRVLGGKSTSETRTENLWKSEASAAPVRGQTAKGKIVVNVDFSIPDSLPDSSDGENEWFTWELKSKAVLPGADFEAEFEVPMFKSE